MRDADGELARLLFEDVLGERAAHVIGRTVTEDAREQFQLTMFTPHTLRRLFEKSGFHIVDVIGKTILPLRKHKQLLENPDNLQRLLQLEHDLAKDPTSAARASHLQIVGQKQN